MAITTGDLLVAAMASSKRRDIIKVGTAPEAAGVPYAFLKDAGVPGAFAPGTPGLNGRTVDGTTEAGMLPFTNAGGANQAYLAAFNLVSTVVGRAILQDLLWINTGLVVTTTTAQAIAAPVALPARDVNGSTNGEGVLAAMLVTTATTNAAAITNMTLSYTNEAGTAGRTATMTSFPATAVIGSLVFFNLQAGDKGIRSVQSVTLGTSLVTGAVSLVLVRQLATLDVVVANVGATKGWQQMGLQKLYAGTALFPAMIPNGTTLYTVSGEVITIEG